MKWFHKPTPQPLPPPPLSPLEYDLYQEFLSCTSGWRGLAERGKERIRTKEDQLKELIYNVNTFIVAFWKNDFDADLLAIALEDGAKRVRLMRDEEKGNKL